MYDFPTSPTVGQAANGYVWSGQAWMGGLGNAGPVTEQYFDLSGLALIDIPVPTWAKLAQVDLYVWQAATQVVLRMSTDGTTFLAGASDYASGGPLHNSGSSAYSSVAVAAGNLINVDVQGDSAALPRQIALDIALTRPDTAKTIAVKGYVKVLDSAAASLTRTYWPYGYASNTALGSALALKALRFLTNSGAVLGAGSWLKVKWLGDSNAIPQTNAIADAPSDGQKYARRNGAWVVTT
jgi:hypothetical protein